MIDLIVCKSIFYYLYSFHIIYILILKLDAVKNNPSL